MSKKAFVFSNFKENSQAALSELRHILLTRGYTLLDEYSESADLLFCIGGDGTFLSFVHKCRFPAAPILGINTGHLGFFQECSPDKMEEAINDIEEERYSIQTIKPLEAKIVTSRNEFFRIGLNEILVRGQYSHVSQFAVSIDDIKIQDFSGDGILVSTPVGSTAYNYSLDGALVSPDLDVLQLTPVAPMNTNAYRCFHSSILLPASDCIRITGTGRSTKGTIILSFDGRTHEFSNVEYVELTQSDKQVHLIRNPDYDYWTKLSSKLL
ncbi:MAG: NAD(+)/NADH kinase [Mogibacterium sp.]|nr:NAD(+)/NADH kinase [Mogibacterium sp.]